MGVDEWAYALCWNAGDVGRKIHGTPVYIDDWDVTSVSSRWLGMTEFALEDASQGTVTILWSGSPPVAEETLGVAGLIDTDPETGVNRINARAVWRTAQ
jgi:hypothetical protein